MSDPKITFLQSSDRSHFTANRCQVTTETGCPEDIYPPPDRFLWSKEKKLRVNCNPVFFIYFQLDNHQILQLIFNGKEQNIQLKVSCSPWQKEAILYNWNFSISISLQEYLQKFNNVYFRLHVYIMTFKHGQSTCMRNMGAPRM